MAHVRLSERAEKAIKEAYEMGVLRPGEIGQAHGISAERVRDIAKRRGAQTQIRRKAAR